MPRHLHTLLRFNQANQWFQKEYGEIIDRNGQEALIDVTTFRVGYENQIIKESGFRRNLQRMASPDEPKIRRDDLPKIEQGCGWMPTVEVRGSFNDDGKESLFEVSASTQKYVREVKALLEQVKAQEAEHKCLRYPVIRLDSRPAISKSPPWDPVISVLRWIEVPQTQKEA